MDESYDKSVKHVQLHMIHYVSCILNSRYKEILENVCLISCGEDIRFF